MEATAHLVVFFGLVEATAALVVVSDGSEGKMNEADLRQMETFEPSGAVPALIAEVRRLRAQLMHMDAMLSLLHYRAGIDYGSAGLPDRNEVSATIGRNRKMLGI